MTKKSTPPPETTPGWAAGFRRRIPFYIILAVVLAALAGILTFFFLDRLQANALPTARAVVARRNLGPGTELAADMVEARPVPEGLLPEGHMADVSQAIGRQLIAAVKENEVLLKVDESTNTKMTFLKSSIQRIVAEDTDLATAGPSKS